jgi:FKBP-type peptidyl-prolyl cis-trans isomerase (trigger factor)
MFGWTKLEKEAINVYIDMSTEEIQAREDLELINRNEMPKECENPQEDHWTFVVIYQSAIDTPAKWKAIEQRMRLYMIS